MRPASNSTTVRGSNRLAVFERIRVHAPVTRSEIARATGLTRASVTNIVGELLREGLVREIGRRPLERGQPPVELDLVADSRYSVGVHLDRDLLSAVLVDLRGSALATRRQQIQPPSPPQAVAMIARDVRSLLDETPVARRRLLGIGVVTVGPLDLERGTVQGPPNFPGWHATPLRDLLVSELRLPVIIDNNATAAAIGEHWYGAGRYHRNFLYIYLGLGVGGGLFLDGRVYRGSGRNAGEFGHLLVRGDEGPVSLEDRVSLLALQRHLGREYADLELLDEKFEQMSPRLLTWLQDSGELLGEAVAGVDNLLDLDAVIIGGRLGPGPLAYLTDATRKVAERLRMANRPSYAVIATGRAGDETAALGAATLPLYQAFAGAWAQGG